MRVRHRAVLEWLVAVADVIEEVQLVLGREQSCSDGVNRGISPALIVEAAGRVEVVEELRVLLRPPEVEVTNFKV